MALIEWGPKLETGIGKVDEQHKNLVGLLNSLHESYLQGDGNELCPETLQKLLEYTGYHFQTEEELMVEFNYPGADQHKKMHADLVEQVTDLKRRFEEKENGIEMALLVFLKDWLKGHILGEDGKFGEFYRENVEG